MKPVQTLLKVFDRINASSAEAARPKVRRAPACEMLEGRQLLNAAWTPPQGFPGWDGAAGKGADPAAHVHTLDATGAKGARGAGHAFAFPGGSGGPGHSFAFPGGPGGVAPSGVAGKNFQTPSAQLQADFQTLQTDQKALQAEIPASLTAAVKAEQAVIQKAFSSLTPTQMKALLPSGPPPTGTPSSNPTTNMTATLTAAGISSSQINTITTDLQNLKTALTTTDPTLQAKIAADEAAIVKDGGPSLPANSPGIGLPGMF
jgi:hypothetical protein